jgi:hypothetical protein
MIKTVTYSGLSRDRKMSLVFTDDEVIIKIGENSLCLTPEEADNLSSALICEEKDL